MFVLHLGLLSAARQCAAADIRIFMVTRTQSTRFPICLGAIRISDLLSELLCISEKDRKAA